MIEPHTPATTTRVNHLWKTCVFFVGFSLQSSSVLKIRREAKETFFRRVLFSRFSVSLYRHRTFIFLFFSTPPLIVRTPPNLPITYAPGEDLRAAATNDRRRQRRTLVERQQLHVGIVHNNNIRLNRIVQNQYSCSAT